MRIKWALAQLYRLNGRKFDFSGEFDFKERIKDIDDIIDIGMTTVNGVGQNVHDDRYVFDLHIVSSLILEDANTLEPVEFPIDINVTEIFDVNDDGEVNVIQTNTIDLEDVIWENVYLDRPMRITKQDKLS